ncbi:MAG: molybdenum cofactor biosynthesis protein MoaE [Candidatus Obscuribacterales bacterium]|jgi:molybdopterin synthase catalytic subunit
MFELTEQPIDHGALRTALADRRSGAIVTFEGWVRDHNEGRQVKALGYEAYGELAIKEGKRILQEALAKFDVHAASCVHRTGSLQIGDIAVWVGVSSAHRGEAFAACQFIIDEIKQRVPIWKREEYTDGQVEWVNCAHQGGTVDGGGCAAATQTGGRQHEHAR